ncbi:MAG: type II toxin-antitoxin system RelE/ParE family toxin [Rickettsiales bacterium]|nr:type II toxin-antitoxin system RelE/ParE family toxin [Rickettsiales bacterium]
MKKHHVTLNPSVYQKLEKIFSYIAAESPQTAIEVLDEIEQKIMSLESLPKRFALAPENITYKNHQVRHFFCKKSFRVIYAINKNEVRILDVRHAAQNPLSANDVFSNSKLRS